MSENRSHGVAEEWPEAVVRDCVQTFHHVRLRVSGECMSPSLRPGETVILTDRRPKLGDVVLVGLSEGLRLHRLVWGPPLAFAGRWRTKADGAPRWDPKVTPERVLATATGVAQDASRPLRRPGAAARSLFGALTRRLRDAFPGRAQE